MKRIIQIVIIVLGIVASVYGISKMLSETITMILPPWLIVGVVSLIVGVAAVGIGFLIKRLLNADWHSLTFASIIIIIIVGIYAIAAYKPTMRIVVLSNYSGEVKLIVAKNTTEKHEIQVDSFGIGYITRKDFDEGFYPRIIKGSADITKAVKEYSKGTFATSASMSYSLDYLSFVIPGSSTQLVSDIDELIRIGAIDTMRLPGNSSSASPN
jgi:hypothetical protein